MSVPFDFALSLDLIGICGEFVGALWPCVDRRLIRSRSAQRGAANQFYVAHCAQREVGAETPLRRTTT
jgi:hypothetical protein